MMEWIKRSIASYQEIIGAYEKQVWERSFEKAVLKSLNHVTRKRAKVNLDLIDVDLVRGSTFTKTKSQQSWLSIVQRTTLRVLFLPIYYKWWRRSTSPVVYWLLSLLYFLHIASFITFLTDASESLSNEPLSLAHLISPCVLYFAVTFIQTQITETLTSPSVQRPSSSANKRVQSRRLIFRQDGSHSVSEQESVGSQDTGIDLSPNDVMAQNLNSSRRKSLQHRKTSNESLFKNKRVINAQTNTDDSTMIHSESVMNHTLDADDESGESHSASIRETLSDSCDYLNTSFEKTTAWLLQQNSNQFDEIQAIEQKSDLSSTPPATEGTALCRAESDERNCSVDLRHDKTPLSFECSRIVRHSSSTPTQSIDEPLLSQDSWNTECIDCLLSADNDRYESVETTTSKTSSCNDCAISQCSDGQVYVSRPSAHSLWELPVSINVKEQKQERDFICPSDQILKDKPLESENDAASNGNCGSTLPTGAVSEFSDNEMTASDEEWPEDKSAILNNLASEKSKVGCLIWESDEVKRVDLTGLEISSRIIQRVENASNSYNDTFVGITFSVILTLTPIVYQFFMSREQLATLDLYHLPDAFVAIKLAFGQNWRQVLVIVNGALQRFCLGLFLVVLLSVAERTFQQRLLFAKNFNYLTSWRRTRKYDLPHFRLNKVRNIKTWLSLRSFLRRRGPQHSIETILSDAFISSVVIVSVISIQLLQDCDSFFDQLGNWELVLWGLVLGIYLMKFITIGVKINRNYFNSSVLITEQINLYLNMEHKPHKKEELMMANSVLRLSESLLKELESPFTVSGLSANPLLYNITKVVVLSAFSAVLTELFGFKLKLFKINLRA